jgi:hypothetical protein
MAATSRSKDAASIPTQLKTEARYMPAVPREIAFREIAFIDPAATEPERLLQHLRPDVKGIVLEPTTGAIVQIAHALEGQSGLNTIHVIAHGRPGQVCFGQGPLSIETLDQQAKHLAVIGRALGDDGQLMLWSCQTGRGSLGSSFVDALARAIDADVAAATDLVGAAARGGSWELDCGSAAVDARPPLTSDGVANYTGLLNNFTFALNEPSNTFTYTVGTTQQIAPSASFSDQGNANFDGSTLELLPLLARLESVPSTGLRSADRACSIMVPSSAPLPVAARAI